MKLAKILGRYPRYFPIPVGVFGGAWCSAVHDFEYPLELDKPTPQAASAVCTAQKLLKQIAGVNLESLKERKRRR
jgi:hypothetical protein